MSTFILRADIGRSGRRLAVKDIIDVAGLPTTAGSRSVGDFAEPASRDAACLAHARELIASGAARIVGKTNLHELAFGVTGDNPWYGMPVNPASPDLVPGGSSSGSATAVAAGEADVALGSDTGGSIRIPAACCAVAGLKTTWGRVPLDGVWPLAPSLDTVGPMARDVAGLIEGMRLLEPGFAPASGPASRVGRARFPGTDPSIDAAVDRALRLSGLEITELDPPAGWEGARLSGADLLSYEAWRSDRHLVETRPDLVGTALTERLRGCARVSGEAYEAARRGRGEWRAELEALLRQVELLALPTLAVYPPAVADPQFPSGNRLTLPVNLAGLPALALPVGIPGRPASLQLVGPPGGEELLLATGQSVESALAAA